MASVIEQPTATERQVSGYDPSGHPVLVVLAKRTYAISADGRCTPDTEQVPLVEEPQPDPDAPSALLHDTDLFPWKPGTDVIVDGHAYGAGRPFFVAAVHIGGRGTKQLLVVGDRSCVVDPGGAVRISAPAPIDRVPLRYTHAYGGRDGAAEARYGHLLAEHVQPGVSNEQLDDGSIFVYPRNPAGTGYLIEPTAEAVEALRLPNLEDPNDPLAANRLAAGSPLWWPAMPLPHATGWVNYDWFPRVAYFGVVPAPLPLQDPVAEVVRGLMPAGAVVPRTPTPEDAFRLTCGASLGMQVAHLGGGEPIGLDGLHPARSRAVVHLPSERPALWVDGRNGRLTPAEPVIHTVVLEPDMHRLTLLWRGAARALRPYLPGELEQMPFRVQWPR
jgi:hypothetical protein